MAKIALADAINKRLIPESEVIGLAAFAHRSRYRGVKVALISEGSFRPISGPLFAIGIDVFFRSKGIAV